MTLRVVRQLPDPHLIAIGRAITNFSGLDVGVDIAISKILKVHPGAHAAITVGFGTESKLDLLESLVETTLGHGPLRKGILSLAGQIRTALTERNFIAHAHWLEGRKGSPKIDGDLGKRSKKGYRRESWTADEIEDIAQRFNDLESRLLAWCLHDRPRRKHVPWHERHLPRSQQSRQLTSRELIGAIYGRPPRSSRASPRKRRPVENI